MSDITVRAEVTGTYKGQINGNVIATDRAGKQVGILQYQQFEDKVLIAWIEVSPKMQRHGIATQLYRKLQEECPDKKITWGMTTPKGTAFRKSIEWGKVPSVTPEVTPPTKDLYWYTIPELKAMCRGRGLSGTGDKNQLIRRLK